MGEWKMYACLIKLSEEILQLVPVMKLSSSRSGLTAATPPTGANTEGMDAAKELISLYRQLDSLMQSYSSLIAFDADRISKIISGFKKSDE